MAHMSKISNSDQTRKRRTRRSLGSGDENRKRTFRVWLGLWNGSFKVIPIESFIGSPATSASESMCRPCVALVWGSGFEFMGLAAGLRT